MDNPICFSKYNLCAMFGIILHTYAGLEYKGVSRVHGCTGECYEEYVALNGTAVEIEQRKQALAQGDEFSSTRSLWAGSLRYGQDGGGGIGPMLAGQSPTT